MMRRTVGCKKWVLGSAGGGQFTLCNSDVQKKKVAFFKCIPPMAAMNKASILLVGGGSVPSGLEQALWD